MSRFSHDLLEKEDSEGRRGHKLLVIARVRSLSSFEAIQGCVYGRESWKLRSGSQSLFWIENPLGFHVLRGSRHICNEVVVDLLALVVSDADTLKWTLPRNEISCTFSRNSFLERREGTVNLCDHRTTEFPLILSSTSLFTSRRMNFHSWRAMWHHEIRVTT